jgi:hypothetical protein
MRRHFVAAFVLVPAAVFAVAQVDFFSPSSPAAAQGAPERSVTVQASLKAKPCDDRCKPDWMDANLRLDQIQVIGTAESYKQRPDRALLRLIRLGGKKADVEAVDYGLPPIPAQLDADVRALAFDVAYDPEGGAYKNPAGANMVMDLLPDTYVKTMSKPGFKVIHVLDVDYRSSCLALSDCLGEVAAWSSAHPRHLPIVITLHTNDSKTPMPGATKPLVCDETALNALDAEIKAAFTADQLFTPDQLQGSYPSLREAAMAHAWPKLGAVRGKVIFVLDDSTEKEHAYQGGRTSLQGRSMFVAADAATPLATFVTIADPVTGGARIQSAVKDGFMVITRADDDTREARQNSPARRDAAFATGAQIVRTNFINSDPTIGSYHVSMAEDPEAMCGAGDAPERCVRFDIPVTAIRAVAVAAAP